MILNAQRLLVRPGMEVTADLWNELVTLVDQIGRPRGGGARRRHLPSGVITSIDSGPRGAAKIDHAFKATLTEAEGVVKIQFGRGFIGGREPTIEGKPISEDDPETGERPSLAVRPDQFAPIGAERFQSIVYFRVTLNRDWTIVSVIPEALKAPPEKAPWTAWKLIGFLLRDGQDGPASFRQMLVFNQAFAATQRRENGFFRPWFSMQ